MLPSFKEFLDKTIGEISNLPKLRPVPYNIGPFTVHNVRVAGILQKAFTVLVSIVVLGSALSGPKQLFLALWRISILLGVYAAVVRKLRWSLSLEQDLLLALVVAAIRKAYGGASKQPQVNDSQDVVLNATKKVDRSE